MKNKQIGFTLIEMMVAVSVMGVLIAITLPSFQNIIQNNNMSSLHNELVNTLNHTRSLAISRGFNSTFCNSNATHTNCSSDANDGWKYGWIVFADKNKDGVIDINDDEIIVINKQPSRNVALYSSRYTICYDSEGYAFGFSGNFTFCDQRGEAGKQGIVLSNNGRIRHATDRDNLAVCPS